MASAATAFPLVLAPLYEPVSRRIHTFPGDPFRGDLVEYLVGNRGHDQPADHWGCGPPFRSRVPMNPLTTGCADRLS